LHEAARWAQAPSNQSALEYVQWSFNYALVISAQSKVDSWLEHDAIIQTTDLGATQRDEAQKIIMRGSFWWFNIAAEPFVGIGWEVSR
jgi:hypothetical protein